MSFINNLNNVDLVVMFITLVFMFYGYSRGCFKEILSIFSLFFSAFISINLYPHVNQFLRNYIEMYILADSISFSIMFIFIYSLINILSSFLVKSIKNSPISIIDKNFGILIGFVKSIIILSLIFILLTITIWKKNIPKFILEARSITIIFYTSSKIIDFIPNKNLNKILQTFGVNNFDLMLYKDKNKKGIEKYNEPIMRPNYDKDKEGYTKNDNESLDRLFNIENDE